MRFTSSIVFAAGTVLAVLACSSSNDATPAQTQPEGGTSSSGDPANDDGGGSSGSTSSGDVDGAQPENPWVKTTTELMQHEGSQRKYILSVPLNYDQNKSYPLYIWLHGSPGSAESASTFALHKVTHDEAIIAYPGAITTDGWDHSAALQDNVDTTFIFAMIDALKAKYSIDASRILLSGWSGGGFMSSLMACRFYDSFKAIGVHSGGAPFDVNGGPNPTCDGASIATFVTHGGADNTVGGDSGFYAAKYWQEHNGCNGSKVAVASVGPGCEAYQGCPADKPVIYCFDENWGHALYPNAISMEWTWFKALP